MTFAGRRPSVEDDLRWKMNFGGRQPLVEANLRWKTTLGGRWPLVVEDLRRKTTFSARWPLVGDNLQWEATFGWRRSFVEDDFQWKTILACCLVCFAAFVIVVWNFLFRNIKNQSSSHSFWCLLPCILSIISLPPEKGESLKSGIST